MRAPPVKICALGNISLDIIVSSVKDMPPWGIEAFVQDIRPRRQLEAPLAVQQSSPT